MRSPAMHGNPKDAHRPFHHISGKAYLPDGRAICGASEWALRAFRSLPHHRTIGMRHDLKAARHRQDPGIRPELFLLSSSQVILAGAVGFEPTVHGTKNRCLTTWPRPNCGGVSIQAVWRVQGQNRHFFRSFAILRGAAARMARARRKPCAKGPAGRPDRPGKSESRARFHPLAMAWRGAPAEPSRVDSASVRPGPQPGTCVFGQVGQCCFDNGLTERHQMDTGNNPPFPARNRHFI